MQQYNLWQPDDVVTYIGPDGKPTKVLGSELLVDLPDYAIVQTGKPLNVSKLWRPYPCAYTTYVVA